MVVAMGAIMAAVRTLMAPPVVMAVMGATVAVAMVLLAMVSVAVVAAAMPMAATARQRSKPKGGFAHHSRTRSTAWNITESSVPVS